ncbi:DinB family protein [Bacillus sp. UNC41MFS5]|nr:DinB family protein [Bacillus sp. UNC41MFS5]
MIDHEIHHKGQLFTYARLIGREKLPFLSFYHLNSEYCYF